MAKIKKRRESIDRKAENITPMPEAASEEEGLYPAVLEEVERRLLRRAREVEGLDEEIALLRVKLACALAKEPQNTELLLKGLTVLIRAVAARARYSPKAEEDLCKNMLNVLKGLGNSLFPEQF